MKCIFNQLFKQNVLELDFESSAYKVRSWSYTCAVTKIQVVSMFWTGFLSMFPLSASVLKYNQPLTVLIPWTTS